MEKINQSINHYQYFSNFYDLERSGLNNKLYMTKEIFNVRKNVNDSVNNNRSMKSIGNICLRTIGWSKSMINSNMKIP